MLKSVMKTFFIDNISFYISALVWFFLTDLVGALLIIGFQFWNISNPILSTNPLRNKSKSEEGLSDKEEFIKNMDEEGDEYMEINRISISVEP